MRKRFRLPADPVRRVRFLLILCVCAACALSVPLVMHLSREMVAGTQDWIGSNLASRIRRTGGVTGEIAQIADEWDLTLSEAPDAMIGALPQQTREALAKGFDRLLTDSDGFPVWCVRAGDKYMLVGIRDPLRQAANVFLRLELACILTLAAFSALIWLVLRKLLRSVSSVNDAARSMRNGAFGEIHLREDGSGQLQEVSRLLNDMAFTLNAENAENRRALGQISHELRTPLASISGYAQLMNMEGLTGEERQSFARVIADESERLRQATDRTLRYAELQGAEWRAADCRPVRVDELLREAVASCADLPGDALRLELAPLRCSTDPDILRLIFGCLLDAMAPGTVAAAVQCAETRGEAAVAVLAEKAAPRALPEHIRAALENALARTGGGLQEAVTEHIHAVQLTVGPALREE